MRTSERGDETLRLFVVLKNLTDTRFSRVRETRVAMANRKTFRSACEPADDRARARSRDELLLGTVFGASRVGIGAIATRDLPRPPGHTHSHVLGPVLYESVVHDPRANFNFHEHAARVLSLDGPRTRIGRGGEGDGAASRWKVKPRVMGRGQATVLLDFLQITRASH